MSHSDLPNLPSFPDSLDPHELLEILIGEFRTPLDSIDGWTRLLSQDAALSDLSLEASESIAAIVAFLKGYLHRAEAYLELWRAAHPRDR